MKNTQINLRGSTALSALVLAGALIATPAMAQNSSSSTAKSTTTAEQDDQGGQIVVTGSLLRRTDTETPSPVQVLSSETLEQRGINTVAEAVQRLSANGSGAITQGWNNGSNFATGANAVSLRGLTVQSTLTIFDGLRMAPYPLADDGHRNFVDLNTIPDAIVDRIEVLKDGASSTYGADAIAGVVNVIMKKEVTGIHLNASAGISDRGDGAEQRIDATVGYGSLSEQGFNFYISGEYQKNDKIMARDRDYPFNTNDLSRICDSAGHCLANTVNFGSNADGSLSAGTTTVANLVAPSTATGTRLDQYTLLNAAGGCNAAGLPTTTLTTTQRALSTNPASASFGKYTWAATQCLQDSRAMYATIQPSQERYGGVFHFTANIGDRAQFYATASYYDVKTATQGTPQAWGGSTTAPRQVTLNPVVLPIYVCSAGVGSFGPGIQTYNTSTGCSAANGTLNPNNPYAAGGQNAILRGRYDTPTSLTADARSLRGAIGINGSFGDNWNYSADFTISNVRLNVISKNYLIPQRLADVIAQGTYNFVNQSLNSQAIRDYISPVNQNVSNSDLWQGQVSLGKSLFKLPGGDLQVAVGASYRHESINNPSANPDNIAHPFERYYTINAVGAIGSRNVKSAFFEVSAPILDMLEVNASGRYDDYSSGQSNFSPKVGAKFTPIRQLAVRGTYSRGFRIPSFNEAYGLPTTGFSTTSVNCTTFAAFCATHPNPTPTPGSSPYNTYVTSPYSLGTTLTGNPALKPERSRSFTAGIVVEPIRNVSFTVDYWNIQVKDLVAQVSSTDRTNAIAQYYGNNGVVNIPGITVTPGVADVANPNALPLLGTINASYNNAGKENVSGIDFGANISLPITEGLKLISSFDAAYLIKYTVTSVAGVTDRYDGTLSPCDYTSCSGSPKWRGSWQNTLDFGSASLTGTVYYTSGYNLAEVDYGADPNDCAGNSTAGIGAPNFRGGGPSQCFAKAQWNFDLSGRVKVADKFTLYFNAMNILNIKPVTDYAAAYSLYQYNPAWGQANIIGRYFRVGAKVDF